MSIPERERSRRQETSSSQLGKTSLTGCRLPGNPSQWRHYIIHSFLVCGLSNDLVSNDVPAVDAAEVEQSEDEAEEPAC